MSTQEPIKVTLGAVYGAEIDSWYFQSILEIMMRPPPDGYVWADAVGVRTGPLLSMGRGQLLGNFISQTDGDCLVSIDTDQHFTPERFWELVACWKAVTDENPDIGIVAGVTWISNHPKLEKPMPNLYVQHPQGHPGQTLHAQTYPENKLMEVAAVGTSNFVMSRKVAQHFADMEINPFHHMSLVNWRALARDISAWDDVDKIEETMRRAVNNADQLGEDLSFCARVREAGYRIVVHTALEFAHSKTYLLDGDDYRQALADRFPDGVPGAEA
jgi:hypothetical protein